MTVNSLTALHGSHGLNGGGVHTHELVAAPFLDECLLLLRPGSPRGVRLSADRFAELSSADRQEPVPDWLAQVAADCWQVQLAGLTVEQSVLVRRQPAGGYARASWEITLRCNWRCAHCYLGEKKTAGGLDRAGKTRLLYALRDAGVVWLQITGGEPTLDADFAHAYALSWDLGMMVSVSTNASTLGSPWLLNLFARRRPYRIAVSLYGADPDTYQAVTGRKGAWAAARRGIAAARAAGLLLRANLVLTRANADHLPAMLAVADAWGLDHHVYPNLTPTRDGGARPIELQADERLSPRQPFTSCAAGRTFFHVDPFGRASICKIDRDTQVDLVGAGPACLTRLAEAADVAMLRSGTCRDCPVVAACGTCPPLARRYQHAKAPAHYYCHHSGGDKEMPQ